jgi:hypothetical protein
MTPEEIAQEKEVAFFAASMDAWCNSALEHDKSIFTLSAGGIGLLITLLTTVGPPSTLILWLYGLAVFCFLVSLITLLWVFRRNQNHIVAILNNNTEDDVVLKRLDLVVLWVFGIGVCFTVAVGVLSAIYTYDTKTREAKDKAMADSTQKPNPNWNIGNESFCGMADLKKSFNGISNLRPSNSGTPSPTPAPAPAQSSQSSGAGSPDTTGPTNGGR